MDSQPLVSVCCLAYNHDPYIRECLEGFVMQKTNFQFEVLIHDDASTDKTADIIREYEAKYPDIIKPIYQTENQYSQGKGPLRHFLFPRAKGKYIAFCEGDDYWIDPEKLQKQFDFMESNPEYSVCATGFQKLYQKNLEKKCDTPKQNITGDLSLFINGQIPLQTCTILARSNLIKTIPTFDINVFFIGDLNFCCHLLSCGKAFFLSDITSVYRILPVSASHFSSLKDSLSFAYKYYNTFEYYVRKNYDEIANAKVWLAKCVFAKSKYMLYNDLYDDFIKICIPDFFSLHHVKESLIIMLLKSIRFKVVFYIARKIFMKLYSRS